MVPAPEPSQLSLQHLVEESSQYAVGTRSPARQTVGAASPVDVAPPLPEDRSADALALIRVQRRTQGQGLGPLGLPRAHRGSLSLAQLEGVESVVGSLLPGAVAERLGMETEPRSLEILPEHVPVRHHSWDHPATVESFSVSEPDTFAEYNLDSQDTSVSSTRCSTSATGTVTPSWAGSAPRRSRAAVRAWSASARSPSFLLRGPRGRSVTRRERHGAAPPAALRHRRPTHTPTGRRLTPPRTLSGPRTHQFHEGAFAGTFAAFLAENLTQVGEE